MMRLHTPRCFCFSSQVTPAILRFPQLFDNGPYLLGRKLLAGSLVTRLQEFIPEWGAAANPNHQVIDGSTRIALGKNIRASSFLVYERMIKSSILLNFYKTFFVKD